MKKQHKAAISFALALIFALVSLPSSALPRFEAKAEITPAWTVPEGYNAHDYTKCVTFLEQTDENGVKNGEKLSETYDPNDPETWGTTLYWDIEHFQWTAVNGEQRVSSITVGIDGEYGGEDYGYSLCGSLDLSGCTALKWLECSCNSLAELDVSGCTALVSLKCSGNNLTEMNVSGCTALNELECSGNNLTELDVSGCTALWYLYCSSNDLAELDVSGCTALRYLYCSHNSLAALDVTGCTALSELECYSNNLTELDLSNNPWLAYDYIRADGNGHIGYLCFTVPTEGKSEWPDEPIRACVLYAYESNGSVFDGFYNESEELLQAHDDFTYVIYYGSAENDPTGTIIARFSGGYTSGDIDGNGSVTVADAIMALRLAMGLLDGSGLNTDAADMDGNGSITLADAIIILRTAMGLN